MRNLLAFALGFVLSTPLTIAALILSFLLGYAAGRLH